MIKLKLMIILLILFCATNSYSASWNIYINGVNLKWLKDAKPTDYLLIGAGMISQWAVHETGHIAYLEMNDIDYNFDCSFSHLSYIEGNITAHSESRKQMRRFAKAGYIVDTAVGLLLNTFDSTRKTYFTKGYNMSHSVGLIRYRFRMKEGDFQLMKDKGSNEETFYCSISAISAYNLLRQEW